MDAKTAQTTAQLVNEQCRLRGDRKAIKGASSLSLTQRWGGLSQLSLFYFDSKKLEEALLAHIECRLRKIKAELAAL